MMSWSPGSRWVGVGSSGGGGGSPSTPSVGSSMVWAPGKGVNSGNQWEELSDIVANSPPGEGLVSVVIDFTAAPSETYAADVTTEDLQRLQMLGGPNHIQVLPTLVLPAGCTPRAPAGLALCRVRSTGGHFDVYDGTRFEFVTVQLEIGVGGVAPLQVSSGFNGGLLENCDLDTGTVFVSSGSALLGSVRASDVDIDGIDDDAGSGTLSVDLDASTEVESPQSAWVSRTLSGNSGSYPRMRHQFANLITASGALDPFVNAHPVDPQLGPIDIDLPPTSDAAGSEYLICHIGGSSNLVRIMPDGTDTIMGVAGAYSFPATIGWSTRLVCFGSDWRVT